MNPSKTPRPGTHTAKVLAILSDGKPHSSFELVRRAYNQNHAIVARLGAAIFELKHRYMKFIVGARSHKNRTKYWYMMPQSMVVAVMADNIIRLSDQRTGKYR